MQVVKERDLGEEVIITLEEYACFGEQSFLLGSEAMATCRAKGYVEIMRLWRCALPSSLLPPSVLLPPYFSLHDPRITLGSR